MRKENYKSDIELVVTLTLGGVEIPIPSNDFVLVFYTTGKKKYICAHKGDNWANCKVINGSLHCYLDNHGLAPGILQCEFFDQIPDEDFADGDQLKVVPSALNLELIYGAGDDAAEISVEVATDVAAAVARANAISEDLEEKRSSDYYRGVGIESVEQTKTSIVSGGENEITFTLTDGGVFTFIVHNGGIELVNYYTKNQTADLLRLKADLVDGKIPLNEIPATLDDVLEGRYKDGKFYPAEYNPSQPDFIPDVNPYTPEKGKIYIDASNNKMYRWDGTQYVELTSGGGSSDLYDYYTKSETNALVDTKYSIPNGGIPANDMSFAVRSSLSKAESALQSETDPTVPAWAKQSTKPSYSYGEITGTPTLANVATSGSYNDLSNKPNLATLMPKRVAVPPMVTCDWLYDDTNGDPFTLQEISAVLDTFLDGWDDEAAAVAVVNSLVAGNDVTAATTSKAFYSAMNSVATDLDSNGKNTFAADNVEWVATLGIDKYIMFGTTDAITVEYPKTTSSITGVLLSFTGWNEITDIETYMTTYGVSESDKVYIRNVVDGQAVNGGTTTPYPMTTTAYASLQDMLSDEDFYDEVGYSEPTVVTNPYTWQENVDVYDPADEFLFTFTCESGNCDLTLPNGVVYGDGYDFDADKAAGRRFQVSIQDGIALYAFVEPASE